MWLSSVYNQTAVDDDKLQVGGWGDEYRMFIQFDLTSLPQTATSAVMWLYAYPRGDSSSPVDMPLYLLTTPWSETAQNYYDALYGYSLGTMPAPTPNSWYGLDITSIYNGWKNGTYVNDGFVFLPAGTNNQFNVFHSSDYTVNPLLRPKLVVTYNGANLSFPLHNGWTPYTATISAAVDHSNANGFGCADWRGDRVHE
ncbi:MAG TPA: DNRLRE domain-containing protein [Candidatus Paceibacterota bacterium]